MKFQVAGKKGDEPVELFLTQGIGGKVHVKARCKGGNEPFLITISEKGAFLWGGLSPSVYGDLPVDGNLKLKRNMGEGGL